jgi:transposase-like protein
MLKIFLAERGISVSYEAIRQWCRKFGPDYARRLKKGSVVSPDHDSPVQTPEWKQRIRPMLGFKQFGNAAVTISGIELAGKIKKGQYKTGKLGDRKATISELWNAALAA